MQDKYLTESSWQTLEYQASASGGREGVEWANRGKVGCVLLSERRFSKALRAAAVAAMCRGGGGGGGGGGGVLW